MEKVNNQLKEIFEMDIDQVNIEEAALLLLQLNRNRILHRNIIRRNDIKKCMYELKKYYDLRIGAEDNLDVNSKKIDTEKSSKSENDSVVFQLPDESKGKRTDHDNLPDEVKALYLDNFNIYPEMRKLHEQLKLTESDDERKVLLERLKKLDTQHRENFNLYDNYKISAEKPVDSAELTKKISAARKYLSQNKKKVEALEGDAKDDLLAKMQERLDLLLQNEAGISEAQLTEFKKLGLNV